MNKTFLLIICDFLLISVLALVEFNPEEEAEPPVEEVVRQGSSDDLVEVLQLSLEQEAEENERLADNLATREKELETTESELSATRSSLNTVQEEREALARERENLGQSLQETSQSLEALERQKAEVTETLETESRQRQQLQAELKARQEELAAKEAALEESKRKAEALAQKESRLETEVKIRETEKQMLEQNLLAAQAEIERARLEAERAQKQTEALTEGVSSRAQTSTALKEEIKKAQPMSLNAIFRQFEDNAVSVTFETEERRLIGTASRSYQKSGVIIQSGGRLRLLIERDETPFSEQRVSQVQSVNATVRAGGARYSPSILERLAVDADIISIPLPTEFVREAGVEALKLAEDPLRFPNAVIIDPENRGYRELEVRLKPGEDILEINQSLLGQLFGEFTPREGDLVFAQSGQLLGLMTAGDRAPVIATLEPAERFAIGRGWKPVQ